MLNFCGNKTVKGEQVILNKKRKRLQMTLIHDPN